MRAKKLYNLDNSCLTKIHNEQNLFYYMTVSRKTAHRDMLHGNSVCLIINSHMSKAKLQKALTISAGADPGFHPRWDVKLWAWKYILPVFLQYLKTQTLKT